MVKILEEKMMVLYPSDNSKRKCGRVRCSGCGEDFWRDKRSIKRAKHNVYCSDKCQYGCNRQEVECTYCGISFIKKKSHLDKSKSGLYFCCREHKDLAQRIENNNPELWLPHYGSTKEYRTKALRYYGNSCAHCRYATLDICEVHHIDKNRDNNELENLIVLCPNCHTSVHKGIMIVENRILKENENKS